MNVSNKKLQSVSAECNVSRNKYRRLRCTVHVSVRMQDGHVDRSLLEREVTFLVQ